MVLFNRAGEIVQVFPSFGSGFRFVQVALYDSVTRAAGHMATSCSGGIYDRGYYFVSGGSETLTICLLHAIKATHCGSMHSERTQYCCHRSGVFSFPDQFLASYSLIKVDATHRASGGQLTASSTMVMEICPLTSSTSFFIRGR